MNKIFLISALLVAAPSALASNSWDWKPLGKVANNSVEVVWKRTPSGTVRFAFENLSNQKQVVDFDDAHITCGSQVMTSVVGTVRLRPYGKDSDPGWNFYGCPKNTNVSYVNFPRVTW